MVALKTGVYIREEKSLNFFGVSCADQLVLPENVVCARTTARKKYNLLYN
jgi:hypothetical protein